MQPIKKLLSVLIFVLTFFSVSFAQEFREFEKINIRYITQEYVNALRDGGGEKLLPYISENTLPFYDRLKELALNANKKKLLDEELHLTLYVGVVRSTFSAKQLKTFSSEEFFIASMENNDSNFNDGVSYKEGEYIENGKNRVILKLFLTPDNSPLFIPFQKQESLMWRVEIPEIWRIYLGTFNYELGEKMKDQGYSYEEFVTHLFKTMGISEKIAYTPFQ